MNPQTSPEARVLGLPFTHTSLPHQVWGMAWIWLLASLACLKCWSFTSRNGKPKIPEKKWRVVVNMTLAKPCLVVWYWGWNTTTQLYGDYNKQWNKDPVIKQAVFHGKYPAVFFCGSLVKDIQTFNREFRPGRVKYSRRVVLGLGKFEQNSPNPKFHDYPPWN